MAEKRATAEAGARPRTASTRSSRAPGAAEASRAEPPPKAEPKAAPREHVCNVAFCPIGLALSSVQGAAPDVLEHLLKAAQEFFLAARAVMDNRAKDFEDESDKSHLERIEIS
jgi:hypothetical protein